MAKKAMSMRGEIVDFDLLKLKQNITKKESPVNVAKKSRFIGKKPTKINFDKIMKDASSKNTSSVVKKPEVVKNDEVSETKVQKILKRTKKNEES